MGEKIRIIIGKIAVFSCMILVCAALAGCEEADNGSKPDATEPSIPVMNEMADEHSEPTEVAENANSLEGAEADDQKPVAENKESDSTGNPVKTNGNVASQGEAVSAQTTDPTALTNAQRNNNATVQNQLPAINNATIQKDTSSGSSYEQIFNEYSQKLADYYGTAKGELQSEASSGKSIDALATSCSNKVSRLAEISTEGVNRMADLCVKRGGSTSEYMNYGTKLERVYMDYGTKLESAYMSGAMNSQTKAVEDAMKDLGISSDISGQYSEEMNKAMDQYNDELNKAMDDYNQQVQDTLKEYGL